MEIHQAIWKFALLKCCEMAESNFMCYGQFSVLQIRVQFEKQEGKQTLSVWEIKLADGEAGLCASENK